MEQSTIFDRQKMIIRNLDFNDLNDWEESFVISIEKQLNEGKELTEKQIEKLEEVWRRNNR